MTQVMFDSNAYDAILKHGDAGRIEARMLSVIATPVQQDELQQIADPARRAALLALFHDLHAAMVEIPADWDATRDSIIGLAASAHCDLLVTDDRALAADLKARAPRLRVLGYAAFRAEFLV